MISIATFVIFGYYLLQVMKLNKTIIEKISNLETELSSTKDNNRFPVDYGLLEGEKFPDIMVTDVLLGKKSPFKLNENKENLILVTGIGCQPCEEVLIRLSHFNFDQIVQNIVLLTFDPPHNVPSEVRQKHLMLVQRVANYQPIIDENVLDTLKVNSFPSLIRVASNGEVIGTYSGHYKSLVNHLEFYSNEKIS
jgi:hypothetical protein